ncbi:hypothetical protein ACHAXR_002016, partial [Thalassiosira sp. AJA248-18]
VLDNADGNLYRRYYFRNPCVPVDFSSINEALRYCPRSPSNWSKFLGDEAMFYSAIGTVVLMPGIFAASSISIGGERWTVGQTFDKKVAIRAAFPMIGATIVNQQEAAVDMKDQPCIAISTCDDDLLEGVQKGISVRLSHLSLRHSSLGADIWGGNTAILVEGPKAQVVIDSCILNSDSGRGLVVTNQAIVEMYKSTIVDCAATGFYLGNWGSRARLSGCNIVRNGFGSRRLSDEEEAGNNMAARIAAHTRMLEQGISIPREEFEAVPPGHSGVYIESSMCWIDDCLLAGNCLTGLSVVRGGFVSLSASDVTENGREPILIEDAHDLVAAESDMMQGVSIRGGVVEGPTRNNFDPQHHYKSGENNQNVLKGGLLRNVTSIHNNTFIEALDY